MRLLLLLLQLSLWTLRAYAGGEDDEFVFPEPNSIFVQGALIPVSITHQGGATLTLTNGVGYISSQVVDLSASEVAYFLAPLGWTGVFTITAEYLDSDSNVHQLFTTVTVVANNPAFGPGGFANIRRRRVRRFSLDGVQVSDFEASTQDAGPLELGEFASPDANSTGFESPIKACA